MIDTTTENPPERTMGLGEVIRANRAYIGISQRGMAKHLNDMDRRSYQRIENGEDPCPPGLLDTVAATTARFDAEVDAVLAAIEKSDDKVVRVGAPTDPRQEWLRCVVGRAYILDEGTHTVELVAVDAS